MAVVDVACPGCGKVLKAPDTLAGKKAQCKACGVKFRIPAPPADGDSPAGDDTPPPGPAAANPFDFFAPGPPAEPAPPPKSAPKPVAKAAPVPPPPAATPEPTPEPVAATAVPEPLPLDDDLEELTPPKPPAKPVARQPLVGGIGRLVLAMVVFGLVVGGVVGGVLVYLNDRKETVPTAAPKPAEPKGGTAPTAADPGAAKTEPKEPAEVPVKNAARPKPPGPTAPAGLPITFQPAAEKPALLQAPSQRIGLYPALPRNATAAFPLAVRVFPPLKGDADPAVLWRTDAGFQGRGEKLTLTLFSPVSGKPVNGVEVAGDGRPDPVCDLSAAGDRFAHAAGGKVTVWNTRDAKKLVDGFDPYAGKPDHAAAGLAAVYLTEPPDTLVTVSTAGAVHAWKVPTKELVGEYVPQKARPRSVAAGRGVTPGPGRRSVVLVVGGAVYEVAVRPTVSGKMVTDLGVDAGRSLGLAVAGNGNTVYVYEAGGRNEKAVMAVRPGGKHVVYAWPADAGDPTAAGWCTDQVAAVPTARGAVVWFEAEERAFRPVALARPPADQALHAAADGHWTLLPNPADPKGCVLVEYAMPPAGLIDPLNLAAKQPVFTLRLDDRGLFK